MPPWTGVGERCAPRATWSCIDEPLKTPGRSRSASLPTPVKGRFSRHRLLRAAGMSTVAATPPSLKLPGMLDEPVGSLPLSLGKQLRQPVVPSLGGKEKYPLCVAQGQDERARPRPAHLLRGLDSAWSLASNPHRQRGNAVAGCGRRWSRPGPGVTFGRGATREPLGRLRWRTGSLRWREHAQRSEEPQGRDAAVWAALLRRRVAEAHAQASLLQRWPSDS